MITVVQRLDFATMNVAALGPPVVVADSKLALTTCSPAGERRAGPQAHRVIA
jgi:hypothetical protein